MLIKGELRFIKMLKTLKVYDNQHNLVLLNQEALQEIEEQLIRGDKFEQMFLDLESVINCQKDIYIPEEYREYHGGTLKYLIKTVKKRHFPIKPLDSVMYTEFMKGFEKGVELAERMVQVRKQMKEMEGG